jgi:hypothetical protein
LLHRLTCTPTAGAGPPSVTVPVAEAPPTTELGLTLSDVNGGSVGYNVNRRESSTPPPETEIVTSLGSGTGEVTMSKKPTPLPAETVAVLGTAASDGWLLVTCTS